MVINTRPSFATGGDGWVTTQVGLNPSSTIRLGAHSVTLQGDSIVLAGQAYDGKDYDFALVRYSYDGTLDTSFGTGGKVVTSVGGLDQCNSVVAQADGKIVVSGYTGNTITVLRYNSDGSLDASFSGDGKVTTQLGISSYAESVVVQPDGKIVVGGTVSFDNPSRADFAVVRYNADGTLDTRPCGRIGLS